MFGYRLAGTTGCDIKTAPVIRMVPGTKYALTLANQATTATNLHTHGLHVSGDGNADDSTRTLEPGECLIYTYDLPADHMGGTFWYHPHQHRLTNEQISGGAFGLLIVDEPNPAATLGVEDAGVLAWLDASRELLLVASKVSGVRRGNGEANLRLNLVAGEWYRLRILAVDPLALPASLTIGSSSSCEVRAAAYDGVWRSSVPHPTSTNAYTVTGATRLDVAVRCAAGDHDVLYGGTTASSRVAVLAAAEGTVTAATPFVVDNDGSSSSSSTATSSTAWAPRRPSYLQDLRSAALTAGTFAVSMTTSQVNRVGYSEATPLASLAFDAVQQWSLTTTNAHPFHLHVYHMQVVSPGGCGPAHEEGEW